MRGDRRSLMILMPWTHRRRFSAAWAGTLLLCLAGGADSAARLVGQTRNTVTGEQCAYRFLVIDDTHILKVERLQRRVNQAAKHPEPVFRLDAPWHHKNDRLTYVSVLYDDEERLFKMWYGTNRWNGNAGDGVASNLLYATSRDGIRWERPKLGLFEVGGSAANNLVLPELEEFNCAVIKDPSDVPARRYKMIFSTGGRDPGWARLHSPLGLAYSHDGLRWVTPRHVNPVLRGVSDDIFSFFFDPGRRRYVLLTRRVPNGPRDISQYESFDLVNWEDRGRVLVPGDARDLPEVRTDIHHMSPFRYGDMLLSALTALYTHPVSEAYGSFQKSSKYDKNRDGRMDLQLAYSHDGRTWARPDDRSPIVPIGKAGDPDQGMVLAGLNPVVIDGETWIYYSAHVYSHNWWDWVGNYDPARGNREIASVMLARMPEDHWVSLDAGDAEGWFQSRPWGPPADILVNADARGGSVAVELVTPDGQPIAGFTRADAIAITSNGKDQKVAWRSGRRPFDLREAHRGGICARFYIRNAKLYSYTMTLPDPDGRLGREKANARWLEAIKHRSDNWGANSNEPASGLPPQRIP